MVEICKRHPKDGPTKDRVAKHKNRGFKPKVVSDSPCDKCRQSGRVGLRVAEHDVSGLDVCLDRCEATRGEHLCQCRHRKVSGSPDVDAAKQRYPGGWFARRM